MTPSHLNLSPGPSLAPASTPLETIAFYGGRMAPFMMVSAPMAQFYQASASSAYPTGSFMRASSRKTSFTGRDDMCILMAATTKAIGVTTSRKARGRKSAATGQSIQVIFRKDSRMGAE